MKKIIFLIVFCFMLPIFADGIIEIVPKPIGGVVATNKIAVRGHFNSDGKRLRIRVEPQRNIAEYFPVVLDNIGEVIAGLNGSYKGFYQHGVELSPGSNRIVLEEFINNDWKKVEEQNIEYNSENSAAKKTLWGRIANIGMHNQEEQRAIYFYPGTRFQMGIPRNETTFSPSFVEHLKTTINKYPYYSRKIDLQSLIESLKRKDLADTKAPGDSNQKCWSDKNTINKMMDEIKDANVNIVMFVYWGDHDATLEDDIDLELGDSISDITDQNEAKSLPDNFWKVSLAPTFPKTCDYNPVISEKYCIHQYKERISGTDFDRNVKKVELCQCIDSGIFPNLIGLLQCGLGKTCSGGRCYKTCNNNNQCENTETCNNGLCKIPKDTWFYHYYFDDTSNCEEIYTSAEYNEFGIDNQNRQYDAIDQLFKAAAERNLLVVPTLEPSVFDKDSFEINTVPLKQRLLKLLEKYGNNPNWLQVYDKEGNPRKVVHISQAIGVPRENSINEDSFKNSLDILAQEITQELNLEPGIGFLLDVTSMPADSVLLEQADYYFPEPEDLLTTQEDNTDSLLGISTFGLPFNQYIEVVNYWLQWSWTLDATQPDNGLMPLEDHLFKEAKKWLSKWKNSGIPIIPDIIPGFDDRWRGKTVNPWNVGSVIIYGDNENWRQRIAKLIFMYNTAGFNLTIWNGYGEGYVWTPYRRRLFENPDNIYSINPAFLFGRLRIPLAYANLNGVLENGNPKYGNVVFNDNYCFAQHLFGADDDGDGVGNLCDNCPNVYNPPIDYELDSEFTLGIPNVSDGIEQLGAILKNVGSLLQVPLFFTLPVSININRNSLTPPYFIELPKKYVYRMQPDSDLDGIGDACDYESSGFISETGTPGFANSRISDVRSTEPKFKIFGEFHKSATVELDMPENSGKDLDFCESTDNGIECNAAVHFCAINNINHTLGYWGEAGSCSTATKIYPNFVPYQKYNFGYSHGSDDFSSASIISWRRRISIAESSDDLNISTSSNPVLPRDAGSGESDPNNDEARKPIKVNSSSGGKAIWNWRKDWYESRRCDRDPNSDFCQSLVNGGDYNVENTMYYALSTSILPVDGDPIPSSISSYTGYNNNHELVINSAYFPPTNTNKFARAARYNIEPMELNYHVKEITPIFHIIPPVIEYCPSCYYDIPIKFIGMNEIYPYDYISRFILKKNNENNVLLQSQRIVFPQNMVASSEISPSEMMGVLNDGNEYFLALNTANSGADWNKLGVIENWDDNIVSMSLVKTASANFFIAERRDQTKHLYAIESASGDPQVLNNLNELPELVYNLLDLGEVSVSGDPIKLVYLNGRLYLLEQSSTNFKMSSYNGSGFVEIQGTMPPQRNILNVATSGKYMFLAGGTNFSSNALSDLWRFDSETDTWTLVTNALQGDFRKVIMQEVDGEIIAFNPVINGNRTFPAFEFVNAELIENITISNFTIPVPYDELLNGSYCLKETGTTIQGGLEQGGECVPFTHPWYNSFSAGATVYSLDGKGNRLYVGTNNAIKVYDISDLISPVLLSSFSTSSRVNDLEVYGNALFAATNGGLYKLDASNDTLTQTLFVSAFLNSQYKVEVYNGKLYVGEDNGIKVRDLDTLSVLTSVNNGSVLDFAIENGEIGLYKDALFSPVEIRDAETLTLKANEFFGCFEIEVGSSDGRFYLSCDDETYRFEDDGDGGVSFTELSGDIRELQDVYTFDGYTYFYDENTIWISTSSDVPAICGNGIVEGDEVCDGGQIDCEELDSNYVSGTATCNSTCDGYDTNNCSDDGW